MSVDRQESETVPEMRLEGLGLVLVAVLLLGALVGAFFLGKWVERQAHPVESVGQPRPDPLAQLALEPASVAEDGLTYFAHLEGSEKELEPAREAEPAVFSHERASRIEIEPSIDPIASCVPSGLNTAATLPIG